MEQRIRAGGGGFFWPITAIACGLIAGGIYGYVIAYFNDAAPSSGLMIGALVFLVTSLLFGRFAMGGKLPPPNSMPSPMAPKGGKYTIKGGAPSRPRPEPEPVSAHDLGRSVGESLQSARTTIASALGSVTATAEEAVRKVSDKVSETVGDKGSDDGERDEPARRVTVADVPDEAGPPADDRAADDEAADEVEAQEPSRLDAPRDGKADDLKRISGIGPALEDRLNGMGFFHYDQIGSWTLAEVAWVDGRLDSFNGRATRDAWVEQANNLMAGGESGLDDPRAPD